MFATLVYATTYNLSAQTPSELPADTPNAADANDSENLAKQANQALDESMSRVAQSEWLQARIRLRVHLFDNPLEGTGSYLKGPKSQMRLELKISLDDRHPPSSLQQVCDGRWLWDHREVLGSRNLRKVDVTAVRDALARSKRNPGELRQQTSMFQDHIGLGGLEELVRRLKNQFDFSLAAPIKVGDEVRLVLHGGWNRTILGQMLPEQKAALEAGQAADYSKLPDHVPDHVVLLLGKDDHFPYRVEYRRTTGPRPAPGKLPPGKLLVAMELFDVKINQPVDELNFFYKSELVAEDQTASYIKELGLEPK